MATLPDDSQKPNRSPGQWPLEIGLLVLVFVADFFIPLGVATGSLYVVSFIFLFYRSRLEHVFLLATVCTVLLIIGLLIHIDATVDWKVYCNRLISIFVIWLLVVYLLHYQRLQQSESDVRNTLLSTERSFHSLVRAADDAIVMTDQTGTVLQWNEAAERLTGWTADEMIGQPVTTFIPDHLKEAHTAGIRRFNETGTAKVMGNRVELPCLHKNGKIIPIELSLGTWEVDGKTFFCGVIRDIRQRRELEDERSAYIEDLENKKKELEQFTYIASHDLQEPLRSIKGFSSLIREEYGENMEEQGLQSLEFIREATERMESLITGLLNYSRAGRDQHKSRVNTAELVKQVVKSLEDQLQQSRALLDIGDLPEVDGFETDLELLFINLISNAIKFCPPERTPEVAISAELDQSHWTFRISDNGIGIAPDHRDQVFDIFKRLHARDVYEGTGIGLALCRKIIERHRGRIWIEDGATGVGSTFCFTLGKKSE